MFNKLFLSAVLGLTVLGGSEAAYATPGHEEGKRPQVNVNNSATIVPVIRNNSNVNVGPSTSSATAIGNGGDGGAGGQGGAGGSVVNNVRVSGDRVTNWVAPQQGLLPGQVGLSVQGQITPGGETAAAVTLTTVFGSQRIQRLGADNLRLQNERLELENRMLRLQIEAKAQVPAPTTDSSTSEEAPVPTRQTVTTPTPGQSSGPDGAPVRGLW